MSSPSPSPSKMALSEGSDREGSEYGSEEKETFEYFGWVNHIGINSMGHEYCHLRFLFLRGRYVEMYKRDPHENRGIKPIRKGVIGHTLMVEELGRRTVNQEDVYVLRFYNQLDNTKKGEIACATAGEAQKWLEAFGQARQQAEYEFSRGGSTNRKLSTEHEYAWLNLEGHRPRVRRYASGLKKLIIGKGPETLLRQNSSVGDFSSERDFEAGAGDVIEPHEWKCVRTVNGIRIFENVADSKSGKGVLVKAVGVVDASTDTVFEVFLSLDRHRRYEWDMLTSDLEPVDSVNGHYDVVYGTYDPNHLTQWQSKRDFVFSRRWFRGEDGAYTILQFPAVHKNRPPRSGYRRTKINPSTWEIRGLNLSPASSAVRCLVTQILELPTSGWSIRKKNHWEEFQKTVPYALLCQVAGLKEYFGANPVLCFDPPTTVVHSEVSSSSRASGELEDDEFYDAISAGTSSEDEDSNDDLEDGNMKLKNVSWAIASLALKRSSVIHKELDDHIPPISIEASQYHGSMSQGKDVTDTNCWSCPGGEGFMIRGKTYLKDNSKITGGDPLLKNLAVDWFKADNCIDKVALHPKCLVQSKAGKELPFILVINLKIPAKPNYSLVLYYGADRPIRKESLLGRFVDGTDTFRNARLKLIPSIVEGYWMVKRAVGTKTCLLGKAITCNYLRQDNFLEIDVDIGSSSVARSVIGLVLGYITSIVVNLAILIEAKEEDELPEYILGTVQLNRVTLDSAIPFEE
ncbi:hypothetical protein NE237_028144 [Protea cynaroides]|uniref:START domain-containing protein n=1 Tax=Protea cynaroides TaxID=273540 RepID=A0A9Q0GSP7_9MAGN|nr:hypothetical protein NE237_028144 [Protea cynaroides]